MFLQEAKSDCGQMEDSTQLKLTLICDGDKCGQDEANYELKMTKQEEGKQATDWKKKQLR